MVKLLVSVAFIWLALGAAGAMILELQRPATLVDVALAPKTMGQVLLLRQAGD